MRITTRMGMVLVGTDRLRSGRIMAVLLVLTLAFGCASVKYTVREASGALNAIATLSPTGTEEVSSQIVSAEEQILDACGTLLDSALMVSVGDHLPLLSWVEVL